MAATDSSSVSHAQLQVVGNLGTAQSPGEAEMVIQAGGTTAATAQPAGNITSYQIQDSLQILQVSVCGKVLDRGRITMDLPCYDITRKTSQCFLPNGTYLASMGVRIRMTTNY